MSMATSATTGTRVLVGDEVTSALAALAKRRGRRYLAVAYASGDAAVRFSLKQGDVAVVDAFPAALGGGLTDPAVLQAWFVSGASVYAYEGLHAKVFVSGGAAIIGSSNLSNRSRDQLTEAAVFTDDPVLVEAAKQAVLGLRDGGLLSDQNWLDHAKSLYRPPRGAAPGRAGHPVLPPKPFRLQLLEVEHTWQPPKRVKTKERKLASSLGVDRRRTGLVAETLWLDADGEKYYRQNDVLLMLWFDEDGQGWVEPPARLLVPPAAVDKKTGVAWTVRDRNASPAEWQAVQGAIRAAGGRVRQTMWLKDHGVRAAVLDLYALADVTA